MGTRPRQDSPDWRSQSARTRLRFRILPLGRFVELLSTNPARIIGIRGGTLAVGEPADVTIFADRVWTVDPAVFASKGKGTPFAGRRLPRRVLATIVGGVVRHRARDHAA